MIDKFPSVSETIKKPELECILESGYSKTWRVYFNETESTGTRTITSETGVEEVQYPIYNYNYIDGIYPSDQTPEALDIVKNYIIQKISSYDSSDDVNSFYLNGIKTWLDKPTRVGLMNSTEIQKNSGLTRTVLWLGTVSLDIDINLAISLLSQLEIYALEAFNVTASHKKEVQGMKTIKEVLDFDYTSGYPEKLKLNTTDDSSSTNGNANS